LATEVDFDIGGVAFPEMGFDGMEAEDVVGVDCIKSVASGEVGLSILIQTRGHVHS
jgi:hypothetical protein